SRRERTDPEYQQRHRNEPEPEDAIGRHDASPASAASAGALARHGRQAEDKGSNPANSTERSGPISTLCDAGHCDLPKKAKRGCLIDVAAAASAFLAAKNAVALSPAMVKVR